VKRRSFLGALSAVAASPKAVAKAAAPTFNDLSLPGIAASVFPPGDGVEASGRMSRMDRAKADLNKLLGKSAERVRHERHNFYINGLDPDTAGLRSPSLGAKIRMTRRIQYEKREEREKGYLHGILSGWFE
jgi:hypothetical protein